MDIVSGCKAFGIFEDSGGPLSLPNPENPAAVQPDERYL
jgi:hypothetical protein